LARIVDGYLRGESLRELSDTNGVIGYIDPPTEDERV
jgi:hypothetical protein